MPARFRDIERAAGAYGIAAQTGKGSHRKLVGPGGKTYIIPAGNGGNTNVPDTYINAFCRTFGIDRDEFRAKL